MHVVEITKNQIRQEEKTLINLRLAINTVGKMAKMLVKENLERKALERQKEEMLTEIQMLLFAEEPHRISEKLFLLWSKYRKLDK